MRSTTVRLSIALASALMIMSFSVTSAQQVHAPKAAPVQSGSLVTRASLPHTIVVFYANGTFVDGNGTQSILSGTVTIDTTSGQITAANLRTTSQVAAGPFTDISYQYIQTDGGVSGPYLLEIDNSIRLYFPTSSLVGYGGGPLCGYSNTPAGCSITYPTGCNSLNPIIAPCGPTTATATFVSTCQSFEITGSLSLTAPAARIPATTIAPSSAIASARSSVATRVQLPTPPSLPSLSVSVCPTLDGIWCVDITAYPSNSPNSLIRDMVTVTSGGFDVGGATVTLSGQQSTVVTNASGFAVIAHLPCYPPGNQGIGFAVPCPAMISKTGFQSATIALP